MDLRQSLSKIIFAFRILGLWPTGRPTKSYVLFFACLIILFNILYVVTCILYLFIVRENLVSLLLVIPIEFVSWHKAYILWYYGATNINLVENLAMKEFTPKNKRQEHVAGKVLSSWRRLSLWYVYVTIFTLSLWYSYPFFDRKLHPKKLIFNAWFPFDYKISPVYEITYVYQATCILYITMTNVLVDIFISALMTHIGVQCAILCDELENMEEYTRTATGSYDNDGKNFSESLQHSFNNCLRHHYLILGFVEKLSPMINYSMFSQIAASLLSYSLTLFNITLLSPSTTEFKTHVIYLISIGLELLVICYGGNEVIVRSGEIANAAFKCGWENGTDSMKKDLIFFMARVQTPIIFHILSFFEISLSIFMSIIQSSYSYFTLLRSATNK